MNSLDLNLQNQVSCFVVFHLSRPQFRRNPDPILAWPNQGLNKSHPKLTEPSVKARVTPARFLPSSTQILQDRRQDFSSQQSQTWPDQPEHADPS